MSLKPPKKSDAGKSWMKAREGRPKRMPPQYHLIVTEGRDTEPAYFEAIKTEINRQFRNKIQLDIFGEGDNTVNLMERARKRALSNPNGYSHVWIVYDTDDFPAGDVNRVEEMSREYSNEDTSYHAIWSNQCIELWFLLHFSFMQSDLHRSEYWPKLTNCLNQIDAGDYQKNRTDMYQILRPYMDTAIANAKRLDAINSGRQPSNAAPGTRVFELIEVLKPYLS